MSRILYFTADDRTLYRRNGGSLELEARFAADEAGAAEFRAHLQGSRGALISVVADLAGEDFHEEQIPYLRGADRDAVVQRRLAQRYRDTRLVAAFSLGQVQNAERRNERLLLASFTNTQQFAPWLDALEDANARLAGVYSVPLLAPQLATRLSLRAGRAFIVTVNRAGVRQCFLESGKLRFARLERTGDMGPSALAMFVRSETHRLAQYLTTLRALSRDGTPIQVLVVAPPGQRATFEQSLTSDTRLLFRTIDVADAARAVSLKRLPEHASAEALYLYLAARKAPREQFASRDDRRRYLIWQLQRGIVATGIASFAGCTLFAGAQWLDMRNMREQAAEQTREARRAAEQYERITAAFPVTQTTTENLRATVVEFRRIASQTASPDAAYAHVSAVLAQFPQVELDGLEFEVSAASEVRAPAGGSGVQLNAAGQSRAVRLEVSGRVNAMHREDYRGITAQVRRFAEGLATSGYELVRTQLPFDITSEGVLTGDIRGGSDPGEAPRFTIVLARPLP